MSRYILALDQGTTSYAPSCSTAPATSFRWPSRNSRSTILSPAGWSTTPTNFLTARRWLRPSAFGRRGLRARSRGGGHRQPARDHRRLEPQDRRAVYNAIVWQDRRTAGFCDSLREQGKAGLFAEKTGLVLDAYFSGTKVRWVLENVPGAREQAEAGDLLFGTVDSWLIWNFTKGAVHATDPSTPAVP